LSGLAGSRLDIVTAVDLATVARVLDTIRSGESSDEDGHEGNSEKSELGEHG